MDVAIAFDIDRHYYAAFYTAWIGYRSRWRRFAIPIAVLFLLVALIALIFVSRYRIAVGVLFVIALFNAIDAVSHRRRWICDRLKIQSREKHVDLVFGDDQMTITTPNSNGTMRYTAFTTVTVAPTGIFLVPDTGVSIFVPRAAFSSDHDYDQVSDTLRNSQSSS